jgi:spermidine synthase
LSFPISNQRDPVPGAAPARSPRKVVLLIFFLSGAAGLIYEIVWARQLVLVYGNTTQAISTILVAFFGGIAVGSFFGGRLADRVRSPLRLYGFLEIALALFVLATPRLFRLIHEIYAGAYPSLQASPGAITAIRFLLAIFVLAPATVLMGATLPVLARYLTRRRAELESAFGRLYTANTFGAILGTALSGFVLIEIFGLKGTLIVGAMCSALAGFFALGIERRSSSTRSTAAVASREERVTGSSAERRLGLLAAFLSGFTSLGYQVLWTRLLSSGTGNTTYVFTGILFIFLLGIAAGAAAVSARPPQSGETMFVLAATQAAVAAISLVGLALVSGQIVRLAFVQATLLAVFPATLALGLTLPLAASLIASADDRTGRDSGLLLAVNTAGAILGTILVPFGLVPLIGSPRSVVLLSFVNALFAVVLLWLSRRAHSKARLPGRVMTTAIAGICGLFLIWPPSFVADPGETYVRQNGTLYASAEDEIASVQAGSTGSIKRLWVAGTAMTHLSVEARLMAILPMTIRPEAQSMLNICFGMGSTFHSAIAAGLSVETVELVPSVPRMFGHFFPDAQGFLSHPRARLVIADGRNYLNLATHRYDLITVDPPPPIRSSGTAILYSREFYRSALSHLKERGLMMEWMPYDQTIDEFRAQVRTFSSVFPRVMIALGPGKGGVFLFGSREPIELRPTAIRAILSRPGVIDDLDSAADSFPLTDQEWAQLIPRLVCASDAQVTKFGSGGPLITDDRPLPEYFLLRSLFGAVSLPMTEDSLRLSLCRDAEEQPRVR